MISAELGVCSWAINRYDIVRAIEIAGSIPGLRAIQIGFFSEAVISQADPDAITRAASEAGLTITSTFVAFEGEDYSSIKQIAATGGYALDDAYDQRLELTQAVADLTRQMGARAVAAHIGTIPSDQNDPVHEKLVARCIEVVDALADRDLELHIETGREPADVLLAFLEQVGRASVAVNFDPANFVVFGADDPYTALVKLADRIKVVHLKDAKGSATPTVDYGSPAPLGTGDAKVARIVSKMRLLTEGVPMLIECSSRDAGEDTVRSSVDYVRSLVR